LKLDYLEYLGVDTIWLSAFYEYGGRDMGYDWLNHTAYVIRDLFLLSTK